jgi:hypothetical protein
MCWKVTWTYFENASSIRALVGNSDTHKKKTAEPKSETNALATRK